MSEPQVDLSYQARLGEDHVLAIEGGGTGRVDGGSPITVVIGQNNTGSTIAVGTIVELDVSYASGPALIIKPTNAVGDVVMGVAMEAIADNAAGSIALLGGPVLVLTTGTIADGTLLTASATSGRAQAVSSVTDVAFAISLNDASGTSSVYAVLLGLFKSFDYSNFPGSVNMILGDGTTVITTGGKGHIRWPFAGTLTRVSLLADQSGSIVVDIYKDSYANFPPTIADTITASAKPTLSSATKYEDSTMTGWTKTFVQGDIYGINVDSAATLTRVTLELKYQRTGL